MYTLLIIVHVIASLLLIASILLQAGRGGGLSDMFGGSSTQTIFGTSAGDFLKKATTVTAIAFLSTSLLLAVFSSKRSRSLVAGMKVEPPPGAEMPVASEIPASMPVETKTVQVEIPAPETEGTGEAVPQEGNEETKE